jgi:putative ABC transport system permease protein
METGLSRDLRDAFRNLRKDRRFALVAILALALGIGASTVVFSVVYSIFFRALPYKDFKRSVLVGTHDLSNVGGEKVRLYFSLEEVRAFREQNHVFEDLIAYARMRPHVRRRQIHSFLFLRRGANANTFDYLGVPPLVGRAILLEDGSPGAPPVFVMNYRLWQREFGGDPKILGTVFVLNGKPTTLVNFCGEVLSAVVLATSSRTFSRPW